MGLASFFQTAVPCASPALFGVTAPRPASDYGNCRFGPSDFLGEEVCVEPEFFGVVLRCSALVFSIVA